MRHVEVERHGLQARLESLLEDTVGRGLKGRDLLSLRDLSPDEAERVLVLGALLADLDRAGVRPRLLEGRSLAMIFHKPSTRTRLSFEVGIRQLGGYGLFLSAQELQLRRGESVADTGRVLSRYVDGIMIRTFAQKDVEDLAAAASVPVINGLTDWSHPCQALADYLTLRQQLGRLRGVRLAYVGDGNNVARSLMFGAARLGVHFVAASPEGFSLDAASVAWAREAAQATGARIELTADPGAAVQGADAIYTDVWTSMGQEAERERRVAALGPYQVNEQLVARAANPRVLVLHCLPAHRGEEITDAVLDGPHSVVFDQAENRLHVQKALMALLMSE